MNNWTLAQIIQHPKEALQEIERARKEIDELYRAIHDIDNAKVHLQSENERLHDQVKELISKGNEVHDRAAYYGQRSSLVLLHWRDLVDKITAEGE